MTHNELASLCLRTSLFRPIGRLFPSNLPWTGN